MLKTAVRCFLLLFFALLGGTCGFAQFDLAGLNGTVSDAGGRRIPGAHVVAVQIATGLRRATISSSSGTYAIPDLPMGVYRLPYAAQGFQNGVVENLAQTVGHTRTLDMALSVTGIKQRVEVSDD